ncbi:hypothetical protein C8J57DRAFT_1507594 [Mycena rebaudengoi]|nr:hypothetical protein C8J57DRAFT_1507594 [Mycena rebaudengoi]
MSHSPPSSTAAAEQALAVWQPQLKLFDHACVEIQRQSDELVIFCPLLHLPVIIAWPLVNGNPVPYTLLLPFLRRNHLHWPCFCTLNLENKSPFDQEESLSCQIYHYSGRGTYASCHYSPPRCSFFMNLGRKSETATLKAEYVEVSPRAEYDSQTLLHYLVSREVHPYVAGYWGEQRSSIQEGRLMLVLDEPSEILLEQESLASPSPSLIPTPSFPPGLFHSLNLPEAALISTLASGGGIDLEDIETLLDSESEPPTR